MRCRLRRFSSVSAANNACRAESGVQRVLLSRVMVEDASCHVALLHIESQGAACDGVVEYGGYPIGERDLVDDVASSSAEMKIALACCGLQANLLGERGGCFFGYLRGARKSITQPLAGKIVVRDRPEVPLESG